MPAERQDNVFIVLQVVGALLLLDQLTLLLPDILPPRPAAASWRYGVFGLVISRATPILFADLLLLFSAYRLHQRSFLQVAGVVHLLVAVVLLAGLGLFALDALEVRRQLRSELRGRMSLGGARVALMALFLAVYSAWAGFRAYIDGGRLKPRQAAPRSDSSFLISRAAEAGRPE